jgi:hypothetical protein
MIPMPAALQRPVNMKGPHRITQRKIAMIFREEDEVRSIFHAGAFIDVFALHYG